MFGIEQVRSIKDEIIDSILINNYSKARGYIDLCYHNHIDQDKINYWISPFGFKVTNGGDIIKK
jgi:hypothetical protein|tara:strand:- start:1961 stop:2152 length:192 start_codon:yes stop_codon:yes gene_type:complete